MDPTAAAAFLQMQQQMQAQAQQMAQLQQLLQQQQQQLAHQPPAAAAAAAPRVDRPRLPAPAAYDGKAASLDKWIADLRQQFEWYGITLDADRMRFATGFIEGSARDWWTALASAARPTAFEDLVAALRKRFQPVTSAETARAKLAVLQQGKSSIHDYVAAFRQLLVSVPSMGEDDRLFQFTRGLRLAIATQLRVHGVASVDATIEMATRVGSLGELAGLTSVRGLTPASAAVGPDDMQLDNIEGLDSETARAEGSAPVTQAQLEALLNAMRNERSSNRSKESKAGGKDIVAAIAKRFKLTAEQVREHFDKGQCFNCDGTGHSSRACTKPPKKN